MLKSIVPMVTLQLANNALGTLWSTIFVLVFETVVGVVSNPCTFMAFELLLLAFSFPWTSHNADNKSISLTSCQIVH